MRLIDATPLEEDGYKLERRYIHNGCEVIKGMSVSCVPTVDAVPVRTGRWIITPYTDYDDTYECSVCGNTWTFIEGTPKDNDCNYCPHCGAKLR